MFSRTAEYALRAMVALAVSPDEPMTVQALAKQTKVPAGYLSKVMQSLGRAGMVSSQRGARGGFTLVEPPEQISLLDIIDAVDPVERIHACPLSLPGHKERLCPLHSKIDQSIAHIRETLSQAFLASMLRTVADDAPLCVPARVVATLEAQAAEG